MGEKSKSKSKSSAVPALKIPSFESFSGGPNFSLGQMSGPSSWPESEYYNPTFSEKLFGAMASSPLAKLNTQLLPESSVAEIENFDGKRLGFKKNRPENLMVGNSPLSAGFNTPGWLNSPGFFSPLKSPFQISHQQALAHVTAQAALSQSPYLQMQGALVQVLGDEVSTEPQEPSLQVSQSEDKPSFDSIDRSPACDGYHWRKYGQKTLKASECPRSYYKCTHLECSVRKKVERSADGNITEISYKGEHNHELPQPNKRRRDSCGQDGPVLDCPKVKLDVETHSTGTETDGLNGVLLLPANSEHVSTEMASEPPVSHESDVIGDTAKAMGEGSSDEPNVKRMKTTKTPVLASSHKKVLESKTVVQTRSEVDILDDGFKWRKYGQKAVKGNHHPRSYYRCTYPGCSVRKHVERVSSDPKSVITTYEGQHSHEFPVIARNRSHSTAQDDNSIVSLHESVAFPINAEIPVKQIAA